jgi:endonuclease-3
MYPAALKDPVKVERILVELVAPEEQSDLCHRLVQFGRDVCTARNPACETCPLQGICPANGVKNKPKTMKKGE